jgi:dipeptidyl aminopeptidase/acylaminoacyl peptidase
MPGEEPLDQGWVMQKIAMKKAMWTIKWGRGILLMLALTPLASQAQGSKADYERAAGLAKWSQGKVFRTAVAPGWLPGGRLWYCVETAAGRSEWVLVAADGKQARYASEAALRAALGSGVELNSDVRLAAKPPTGGVSGERTSLVFDNRSGGDISLHWWSGSAWVPYGSVKPGARFEQGTFADHLWEVRDAAGKPLGYVRGQALPSTVTVDSEPAVPASVPSQPGRSPDGKWLAYVEKENIWIKPVQGGPPLQLSSDGKPGDSYAGSDYHWSPDSSRLVAFRTEAAQQHNVTLVESSPKEQLQPKLHVEDYLKPGDKISHPRPVLFDIAHRKAMAIADSLFPNPWSLPPLDNISARAGGDTGVTWAADSSRFFFAYNQRGHQLMRVLSVDGASGEAKSLFEDRSATFIHYSGKYGAQYLPASNEILWMSERDGWNHLYLHDASTGKLKRQLTHGNWVVQSASMLDEKQGTLLLAVSGRKAGEDPYHVHYAKLELGTGKLLPLTEGDGTHRLQFSPDGSHYLDSYSRVDLPTVTELRNSADGKLLAVLERGDAGVLKVAGWQQPERFVAKGRDGKTDIWGVVWRPTGFSAQQHYPVIEQIYAGPHGHFVPKSWSAYYGDPQQLAELGFIVVQIDGMGTDGRGKAFQDVSYKNLKDAGFEERILWIKALAAKYPYLDLNHVGIYGGSAGGQNAMAALLWHGDFYKVAVADCGSHDNRMDKIWWNEQWMGYPVDKSYEDSSNAVHAAQLSGKLMLTVGELDTNVDPSTTMQVVNALIKADKDFELLVFPGSGHGAIDSPYGRRRRMDFFVRNLLGVEPRLN